MTTFERARQVDAARSWLRAHRWQLPVAHTAAQVNVLGVILGVHALFGGSVLSVRLTTAIAMIASGFGVFTAVWTRRKRGLADHIKAIDWFHRGPHGAQDGPEFMLPADAGPHWQEALLAAAGPRRASRDSWQLAKKMTLIPLLVALTLYVLAATSGASQVVSAGLWFAALAACVARGVCEMLVDVRTEQVTTMLMDGYLDARRLAKQ